ncbi:MAG: hypothetical protein FWE82_10125 [Defluviitaleaceae bacterium]|nr:hypothetical protein [Defluviitaleaceae bacterium]
MMISKKEIILIMVLVVLINAAVYYLLFYQPNRDAFQTAVNDADQIENEISAAMLRVVLFSAAENERLALQNELKTEHEKNAASGLLLPSFFSDSNVLRLIQKNIYPYTEEITVLLPIAYNELSATGVYTVDIRFDATYQDLLYILDAFKNERTLYNRIVDYTFAGAPETLDEDDTRQISLRIDFIVMLSK